MTPTRSANCWNWWRLVADDGFYEYRNVCWGQMGQGCTKARPCPHCVECAYRAATRVGQHFRGLGFAARQAIAENA